MRIALILFAPAALLSTPVLAQQAPVKADARESAVEKAVAAERAGDAAATAGALEAQLADPATKEKLSAVAVAMMGAMMDMKVGPMVAAAEGRKPTKAESRTRVRDMVAKNGGEEKAMAAAANSGAMLAGAGQAMIAVLPKLIEAMAGMKESAAKVVANLPRPVDPTPAPAPADKDGAEAATR